MPASKFARNLKFLTLSKKIIKLLYFLLLILRYCKNELFNTIPNKCFSLLSANATLLRKSDIKC